MNALTVCGIIQKSIGFKGKCKASLYDGLLNENSFPSYIWILQEGKPVPYFIEQFELQNESTMIFTIEDIHSLEDLSLIKGREYFIESSIYNSYFKQANDYESLIGLTIIDETLGEVGSVKEINTSVKDQTSLVVNSEGNEILIPYVDAFIVEVDYKNKQIKTFLPEGLVYLNKK